MATESVVNGSTSSLPDPSSSIQETSAAAASISAEKKWPGWPGDTVFRVIIPVAKVGCIIGKKGELIKKMCEDTRARIRVLEGALGTNDRIVLISSKEEPEAALSPAMNAVIRVFRRITGLSETDGEGSSSGIATCSFRLLVASSQAINLIGKQGSLIKSIQESSAATVRVLSGEEVPHYATSDERIVEIQGEALKVLKALEAIVGHLRKFLVDHSVIPLFEKSGSAPTTQDRVTDTWVEKPQTLPHPASQPGIGIGNDYPFSLKRENLYIDREPQLESHTSLSLYGQDPALVGLRPLGITRSAATIVTQVTQTMQIPLSYAEDIIGIGGANIAYIRRTSGAILTVQESRGLPDEITVEIKGTSIQVQTAQQLIHEFIAGHKEPSVSSYGNMDTGLRSYGSHQMVGNSSYQPSSLPTQPLGGYGSSGLGGYNNFRL
ncbi:hypothetical protein C5167_015684 [Papaver somniferum]|uniref:K Homology domain-containing protein n=1 Tax=Papaver somniferum TaxID=3469 RepID=A0A4Y7JB27_PAPSO|nr:RNA-binding KH domain-containing protein PEPPER-like [Papaver somniferum]RZC56825.1 hypothetical protein C5167_015684 [Papaver somniferum]